MNPEIFLYINKAKLDDDETRLLSNPPCELYTQITEFISPNPNNIDHLGTPKPQNPYILYRKNNVVKHKSLGGKKDWETLSKETGGSWKNESNKVRSYFRVLAKLAFEKHKTIYYKKYNNPLPNNRIFIAQQPAQQLQKKFPYDNERGVSASSQNPYTPSLYKNDMVQHLQNQDNNRVVLKSPSPHHSSSFSCTNDNPSSLPSTFCLKRSAFNPPPDNYDNIISKTDSPFQPTQFNGEDLLEKFQQFLQDEQTDKLTNGANYWRLLDVFCRKMDNQ